MSTSLVINLASSASIFASVLLILLSWKEVSQRLVAWYLAELAEPINTLGLQDRPIAKNLQLWAAFSLAVTAMIIYLRAIPLAVVIMYFLYQAPRWWFTFLVSQRRKLLRDQIVESASALANTARAGLPPAAGLQEISKESPEPLRSEILRIVSNYEHGMPLETALHVARDRLQLPSFTAFATVLGVGLERGGPMMRILDRVSQSLEENQRLERRMETETSKGRWALRFMAIFPIGFIILFAFIYPSGMGKMFTDLIGQIVTSVAIILIYLGISMGQKILNQATAN